MKPILSIVMTTINVPTLLEGFAGNFKKFGHLQDVSVVVVGDRKTPHAENAALAKKLTDLGLATEYMDIPAQDEYMRKFPEMDGLVPYNSDQRRVVGYLRAGEIGAERIGLVDDDNFATEHDWFGGHSIVGTTVELPTASSSTGWFNPLSMMNTDPPGRILYTRGHPYSKRHRNPGEVTRTVTKGWVAINAGLWSTEADVDSLTRLTEPVITTTLKEDRVMCAPGTWSNINSQNTTFHRDVLPAIYFIPLAARIGGHLIERYGDIWAGLFARKAVDHMNHRVVYGVPVCDQQRNVHNLLKDLQLEYLGLLLNEQLCEAIYSWKLDGKTYAEAYLSMADHLEAQAWYDLPMLDEIKRYFENMAHTMRQWVKATRRLGY